MAEEQDTTVAEDTTAFDTTQTTVGDNGLPTQEQHPEAQPEATVDGATPQQAQQPQQQATAQPGTAPAWWKPDLFNLKYRGSVVAPKDYNHAVSLMQKGWSYEQAMAEVKREKADIEANKGKYEQYERLEKAFNDNPAFRQRILQMQQETAAAQGQQQAPQGQGQQYAMDPQIAQKLGEFEKFVGTMKEQQADAAVESEIGSLRSKFADTQFDQVTESGHTLMWDILNHAHQNRFPNLMAAYRDYMFDTVAANAKMQGAQQVAQQRQSNVRRGVVSAGAPKPGNVAAPADIRGLSYDKIAELVKKERGLTA